MREENFEQQLISEKVPIVINSQLSTNRSKRQFFSKNSCNLQQGSLKNSNKKFKQFENQSYLNIIKNKSKYRQPQIGLIESIQKRRQQKQNRLKMTKKQLQQKQMKDCTFKPKINENRKRRSINEFLQQQQNFNKRIVQKNEKLKQIIQQQQLKFTFKPKINHNSISTSQNISVYDRLYNQRNKQNESIQNYHYINQNKTFNPFITERSKNIIRDIPISEHLYNDALQRRKKSEEKKIHVPIKKIIEKDNLVNEKYAAQKFIKEYYSILQELDINHSAKMIDFNLFVIILKKLSFMTQMKTDQNEIMLAENAYKYISNYSMNIKNICVFLMALGGIYHINPINFEQDSKTDQEVRELNLDKKQGRKLQKKFQLFFRNRLYFEQLKKTQNIQIYQFRPQINQKSRILAQNYRNKILLQTTQFLENNPIGLNMSKEAQISHADLLNLNKISKQIERSKKRQQIKEQDLRECTFRPNLLDKKKSKNHVDKEIEGGGLKKYEQLYNLSKNLKKVEKSKNQIQYQKNQSQCTFKPKINQKITLTVPSQKAKDFDKSVIRMTQARKSRELIASFFSLHDSKSQQCKVHKKDKQIVASTMKKDHQVQQQQQEEQLPFLVIDVNMGDKIEQIIVYRNQTQNQIELAKQFALKHNLDKQSENKLVELLRIEINNILDKIDQEPSELCLSES